MLYFVPGLGIGISTLAILAYQHQRGELPMTPFGWRLLGSTVPGMGADQLTPTGTTLAWVLIGVSALDAATGIWLWQGRARGTITGLVTTPVSFILAVLFMLPFVLVVVPLRALLVIFSARGDPRWSDGAAARAAPGRRRSLSQAARHLAQALDRRPARRPLNGRASRRQQVLTA